jgi:O-succinylbenzoic acid--CoA ligase
MINDILNERAIKYPDKIFITYKKQKISYARFNYMVNGLYNSLNTKACAYIGLQINDKLKLLIALVALNRKKSIPIIYPNYPNIDEYINTTKTPVSIKDFQVREQKNDLKSKYIYRDNDTQIVMFTSGSSGVPKPCELTYSNFYESAKMWDKILGFEHSDVYLNHMPLTHVSGMCIFFRSLYYNFEMILDDFKIDSYIKHAQRVSLVSMVPAMIKRLQHNYPDMRSRGMKAVVIGGDDIDMTLLQTIKTKKIPGYVSYGLTESCSGIAGAWIEDFSNNLVYNAHPGVAIGLSGKALTIVSPTIIKKYFNLDKPLNKKLITSDCIEVVEKNKFKFTKRLDDIVISGGENISLKYIKKHLLKYDDINSCDIEVMQHNRWGQAIHAILSVNKNIDKQKFYKRLKQALPNHMIPKKITMR